MDELLRLVGEEFEKLLKEKQDWNRDEVISLFYKAWVLGMHKYAKSHDISGFMA